MGNYMSVFNMFSINSFLFCLLVLILVDAKAMYSDDDITTLECTGSVTSSCEGTLCVVSCSDGSKVELQCEDEGVEVNSTEMDGVSQVEVSCGAAVRFAPCFPFCG